MSNSLALTFNPDYNIGDIISLLGFLVAAIGIPFAGYQLLITRRTARSQSLLDMLDSMFFKNDEVNKLLYDLDWNKFKFDEANPDNQQTRTLDRLLCILDVLGDMLKKKVIKLDQVEFFSFHVTRMFEGGDEVERFLKWLDGDYARFGFGSAHANARYFYDKVSELRTKKGN